MAYNTCTPANIYGPYDQTLFLGCSIMSFTASVGWNDQSSELTVELVEDPCDAPEGYYKTYWDENLNRQTMTGPDPGFMEPSVGTPAYFRIADFEFGGLIQSWTENQSTSGRPTYTVKLTDPRQIVEGTEVIIENYAGSVYGTANLLNVFGYMESYGESAPLTEINGATFGSPAGAFGGANTNENGMQWNRILTGLRLLTSSILPVSNMWSPYGRLVFRGSTTGSYGLPLADLFDQAFYLLDLSELPVAPSYWRYKGPNINLMELIRNVCSDAGCDYYVELVFVPSAFGLLKFIKFRTVSRVTQPDLGQIDDFVGSGDGTLDNNHGLELRNEVTQTFVYGDNVCSIYQAEQDTGGAGEEDDMIVPHFGLDNDGNALIPDKDGDGFWQFEAPTNALNLQLTNAIAPANVTIQEKELMAALNGFDIWLGWACSQHIADNTATDIMAAYRTACGQQIGGLLDLKVALGAAINNAAPRDFMRRDKLAQWSVTDPIHKDLQILFAFVENYASNFYGIQFQVRIPYTAAKIDNENSLIVTSEIPTDSGWTEYASVLGLSNPSAFLDFFSEDNGRVKPFVRIDDTTLLDWDLLSPDNYLATGGDLYLKADVDANLIYEDVATHASPRVVVKLSQNVKKKLVGDVNNQANLLPFMMELGLALMPDANNKVGSKYLAKPYGNIVKTIDAACVPLKSNIAVYGPWYSQGPPGQVRVEQDSGLAPWEYGSVATMNLAGNSKATEGVTYMQVGEQGAISVPGYPTVPLGAELGALNGGFFGGGSQLVENRSLLTSQAEGNDYGDVELGQWTGLYGPNITGISVDVGVQGVRTSYTMRTFTPQFGRFSKGNSERFKRAGQNHRRLAKQFRLAQAQQNALRNKFAGNGGNAKGKSSSHRSAGQMIDTNTPHETIVGAIYPMPTGDGKRSIIATESVFDDGYELLGGYANKAFMSFEGLLRPVSMTGGGGLPRYVVPTGASSNNNYTNSIQPMPPFTMSTGGTQYGLKLSIDYFNPLRNPSDTHHGNSCGHDFDILGRGSTAPSGTAQCISAIKQGYLLEGGTESDYTSDYRFLALRGPMMLQSWGYDLNGKPVPNNADTEVEASAGRFIATGLKDTFMDNWLIKSHTWPVAPVDLRLDRKRGVWVSPPTFRLITAQAREFIGPSGSGSFQLTTTSGLYDAGGGAITATNTRVTAKDINGQITPSGSKAILYYNVDADEYYILERTCPFMLTKTTASWAKGAAATVNIWAGTPGAEVNTGYSISAYNKFGVVASGKWVGIIENHDGYYAIATEC